MKNIQVAFNLTGRCNLNCTYCATERGKWKTPDIRPKIIIDGFKKIRKKHPDVFLDLNCMGNGEPLLNWEAIETMDNLRQKYKKIRCFVTTNGTIQDKILYLAKKNWIITISYDGIKNNISRGKSSLVKDTIKKLVKAKANFVVRVTLTPENADVLRGSLKEIKKLGVNYVVLGPVFPIGKYQDKKIKAFNVKKILNDIKKIQDKNFKIILSTQEACSLATRGYYIMPDGKISICYVKYIKPTKKNRDKANKQGCILHSYKGLFDTKRKSC